MTESQPSVQPEQIFQAFHAICRKSRINQARIQVLDDEKAGRVLTVTYRAGLNLDIRDQEMGNVMGAAAYALVALDPPVTGGCVIIVHDGNGRMIRQAAVLSQDASAYVAGKIDKRGFVEAWTMR
jgi:hypothetical protein